MASPGSGEVESGHQSAPGSITVDEILNLDLLRDAVVLAGREGLARRVERLNVMSGPEILPWAKSHEFMLTTGYPLPHNPEDFVDLVCGFAGKDLSALGIKFGQNLDELPEAVVRVADELALPLICVPADVSFDDILGLVLSEIVNRQNAALSRVQEILDSFLEVVLAGGGLAEIVARLSSLLGGALVAVADETGRILTSELDSEQFRMLRELGLVDESNHLVATQCEAGSNHHKASGLEYLVSPIRAGSLWQGTVLVVGGDTPLDQSATVAVEQAATAAALDRMRQVAISTVTRQFEASILHDVITGRDAATTEALIRTASVNWDFDRDQVVIISSMEWSQIRPGTHDRRLIQQQEMARLAAEVRSHDPHAAIAFYSNEFVAVVGIDRNEGV
ncbi:MAG TPA: PucR family transcriptional regulator ligand-binding domain-containing protein, partial [Acidimicrobiales bacterium]|nr:PucR family transcriptional regulator ligand-binding domain-containing protein [Acidimicrobiales bacterium]